jgi:hypothetical protein
LLSRIYSGLLAAAFFPCAASEAYSGAGHAAQGGAGQLQGPGTDTGVMRHAGAESQQVAAGVAGIDLALCTRLVEGWQRHLTSSGTRLAPATAAAAEALAGVRILGLQQYKPGTPTRWQVSRLHPAPGHHLGSDMVSTAAIGPGSMGSNPGKCQVHSGPFPGRQEVVSCFAGGAAERCTIACLTFQSWDFLNPCQGRCPPSTTPDAGPSCVG